MHQLHLCSRLFTHPSSVLKNMHSPMLLQLHQLLFWLKPDDLPHHLLLWSWQTLKSSLATPLVPMAWTTSHTASQAQTQVRLPHLLHLLQQPPSLTVMPHKHLPPQSSNQVLHETCINFFNASWISPPIEKQLATASLLCPGKHPSLH